MEKKGIILHADYAKHLVTVLHKTDGKQLFYYKSYIPIGACVYYMVKNSTNFFHLVINELCSVPIYLASHDLMFLHTVLAIYNYSIPVGGLAHTGYDFLFLLYDFFESPQRTTEKKIFLIKILMIFGFYTTRTKLCSSCIAIIHKTSVDSFLHSDLHLDCLDQLDLWIHCCIEEHIKIENFYIKNNYGMV